MKKKTKNLLLISVIVTALVMLFKKNKPPVTKKDLYM